MNKDTTTAPYPEGFLITNEYLRFEEFARSCAQYKHIGVCHGNPGVGKTLAARYYAQWEPFYFTWCKRYRDTLTWEDFAMAEVCQAVYYHATLGCTMKTVREEVTKRLRDYKYFKNQSAEKTGKTSEKLSWRCPLVIIDEADRLNYNTLEQVRDLYEQYQFSLILIGMPGIEKRLSRYPQLYSRIGFSHAYRPLSGEEVKAVLTTYGLPADQALDEKSCMDNQAIETIIRFTGGNFRLINRILSQIERLLEINRLHTVTKEVVEAARSCLLIGEQP